ncbi:MULTISPECIES: tyrosine-type recombinase/integrase [Arthrobacter]|uniref:Tyrosine-type recombinase/integrase n=2 Tax=Arthrobacter TaxID=1663 RepID=A0ABU9KL00_9MICC|nr:tyrosine-type recombinase/integrase [Arthrobacter sp. YJM1]MDP5226915.1 tyrosine-type recombinase/integrase [Arthrobacter sp. YJM1]
MTVHDLWAGLSKAEIAEKRAKNAPRWQRRWREGTGREAPQRKQSYKEHQKAQAYQDDAAQMGRPKARSLVRGSVTVGTLLDRHLAAKADRAPGTVEVDRNHAGHVRRAFGDRVVSTLDTTEVEIWSARPGVAAESRKKQVEILRAAIKRGIRDRLVDSDPTEGIVVSLGHRERPAYSSAQLMAILAAASTDFDRALLGVLGLMGLRSGEARSLLIGDLRGGVLSVKNGGAGTDTTKTRASRRMLPVPATVLPWLETLVDDRPSTAWLFASPRKKDSSIAEQYANQALARAVARANQGCDEAIPRYTAHALRHTFAAISLSEAGADLLAVSRAMGHARPSITLDRYGHLAPAGLGPLMTKIDELVAPLAKAA